MDRRSILKGASGIAAASTLSGCLGIFGGDGDGSGGGSADATVWHSLTEGEQDDYEANLRTFNDENEAGWEIGSEETSDLRSRVETSLASTDGPELYRWAHDWVGNHYDREFVFDATDHLSVDIEETYSPAAVDAVTIDGATVGLPVNGECPTIMYNKDMIDSPPETLDEMVSIMEDHYDPTQGQYGIAHPGNEYFLSAWLHAFGGYYFDVNDSGEAVVGHDLDATKEGMELFRDNIWPYMAQDTEYDPQAQVFQNGNAPLIVDGPWAVSTYTDSGIDVGVAPFPEVDGNMPKPYTGVGMWYFSVMMDESEDARDAAIDYAEWQTTQKDQHIELAENHNYFPVLSEIEPNELPDRLGGFQASFSEGIGMPNHPRMGDVWAPTGDAISAVLLEDADIDQAFDDAAASVRESWEE